MTMIDRKPNRIKLYIALTHYPVVNKNGDVITSAVTNLDLHDIARASKTYGVDKFFVITPFKDQKTLIHDIVSHWIDGYGATYNPHRGKALELIRIQDTLDHVKEEIESEGCGPPQIVATTSREDVTTISFGKLRETLLTGEPVLLVFGTAWGLSAQWISRADHVLEPIKGKTGYNHLSVRSAASIMLDRLMK